MAAASHEGTAVLTDPLQQPPAGFVSRAEHDALRAAHSVILHRWAIVALLVFGAVAFVAYSGRRDYEEFKAARAAEKAVRAVASPGAPPQPIVIQVPTVPVIQPTGFLGRGGGSGQTFNRREVKSAQQKPGEARNTDTKSGAHTVVKCPTGDPAVTVTVNANSGMTTTYACPPAPPPPPNVTRFDPPTGKDAKAFEGQFRIHLADYDILGKLDPPRTRTGLHYAFLVPKGGGDMATKLDEEPRSTWAWGRHFELYGEVFRQQSFGIGTAGAAVPPPGFGAAAGAALDAFRYKDLHAQPLVEGGWAPGGAFVKLGIRTPLCIGAECP